jgi:sulfite reductase alpha subunit-like flavoprotein
MLMLLLKKSYLHLLRFEFDEVGDCLVVLPQNDPALVELLMSTLGWDPGDQIQVRC